MSYFNATVPQLKKMLGQVDACIAKGIAYAEAKGFDPEILSASRLAPDQYSLARQVQAACDGAKIGVSRLTGKPAPVHDDGEAPLAALRARIADVIAYLDTITESDFVGTQQREIVSPIFRGKALRPPDYLNEMVLPNFYFHVSMAYAILRHNGVPLGKDDYLGSLRLYEPKG